jgi:hypothetical protein
MCQGGPGPLLAPLLPPLDATQEDEVLEPEAEDSTGAGLLLEAHSDALLDCRRCRGGAAV